jgi:hypothetical protein
MFFLFIYLFIFLRGGLGLQDFERVPVPQVVGFFSVDDTGHFSMISISLIFPLLFVRSLKVYMSTFPCKRYQPIHYCIERNYTDRRKLYKPSKVKHKRKKKKKKKKKKPNTNFYPTAQTPPLAIAI